MRSVRRRSLLWISPGAIWVYFAPRLGRSRRLASEPTNGTTCRHWRSSNVAAELVAPWVGPRILARSNRALAEGVLREGICQCHGARLPASEQGDGGAVLRSNVGAPAAQPSGPPRARKAWAGRPLRAPVGIGFHDRRGGGRSIGAGSADNSHSSSGRTPRSLPPLAFRPLGPRTKSGRRSELLPGQERPADPERERETHARP
jgi:hypothetical protein